MSEEKSDKQRLKKVADLLQQYLEGNLSARETYSEGGDLIDTLISNLHQLAEKISSSGKLITVYEERVPAILNNILAYKGLDFSQKVEIKTVRDEIDTIGLALNELGEELKEYSTSQKKQTQELEKLSNIIETTADAVIAINLDGRITLWNKSAERIFGYAAKEVLGKSAANSYYPTEETTALRQIFLKLRKGTQFINRHSRITRKDGTIVDVSLTLSPVYDGSGALVSISAFCRDTTIEKKAEEALRESEQRSRSLVESVKDYAIIMLDPDGNVTSWNKGAEPMKGYRAEDVLGKNFSAFFSPEDKANYLPAQLLAEARENGKATYDGKLLTSSGSSFWGYVVLTCIYDSQGRIIGYSKITHDQTEIKKRDKAIHESQSRLEQKNEQLERMNKELASFAYVSSHDLQEPLRKIQTFAGRILDTDFENLSEQSQDFFHRLTSAAQRMQQLILDILAYSRISSANALKEKTSLTQLAEEVRDEFKEQLDEASAAFSISVLPDAEVIPFQIKQLFSNLLSNAIKFRAKNFSVHIALKAEIITAAELPEKISRPSVQYCHLLFSDNGIGFEKHFAKQIFEVFQRLHSQDVYKGTGIGLAICKKITENHGGLIRAESEEGKGAVFHVYLPL